MVIVARNGCDPGGDPALHIDRATSDHGPVMDFGAEGIVAPQVMDADRNHIGMARETEIRRGGTAPRIEVFDFAEFQACAGKAEVFEYALHRIHGSGIGRGHRGPRNQRLC